MNQIIKEDLEFITESNLPWHKLEGKNILIAGAGGSLAAYLVKTILYLNETRFHKKAKVFGLIRNKKSVSFRFADYKNRKDLVFFTQDVCNPIKIKNKIHFIIHAASRATPKYYGKDPVGVLSANILGTTNLLKLAKQKKVASFLFFSSGEVYGEVAEKDIPTKENMYGYVDPTVVRSCYAESKRMGETICVSYAHQYGVPAKIVRPFHTYGPGMALDDGRVYADFVSNIVNNQNIIMKSNGSATRAFCYIADATIGFFKVLLQGKTCEPYNVGNDKGEISIMELAHRLVKLFPEKKLKVIRQESCLLKGYIKSKISRTCPDISKIRALGWTPKYSIEEGFSRTVRSFSV